MDPVRRNTTVPIMDHGTTWRDGAVHIEALKAKHNQYDHTPEGGYPYLSYGIEVDGRKVFFAGDTIPHAPLDTFLRQWAADLAFLPINGCTEELLAKGFASNLSYQEAIALSSSSHVRWTVPCHYDMLHQHRTGWKICQRSQSSWTTVHCPYHRTGVHP